MMAYNDFWTFKGGVYQHISGSYLGGISVKLIGYTETTWIGEGMWGDTWGDKGYF